MFFLKNVKFSADLSAKRDVTNDKLREAYERNKQRARDATATKSSHLSVREWFGIVISIAAFSLSATTTYLASLRTLDEVQVVIDKLPTVRLAPGQIVEAAFFEEPTITFINSGNRTAAITEVFMGLIEPTVREPDDSKCGLIPNINRMGFRFAPITLKPNDILPRPLSTQGRQMVWYYGDGNPSASIKVCLSITIITPREVKRVVSVLLEYQILRGAVTELKFIAAHKVNEAIPLAKYSGVVLFGG